MPPSAAAGCTPNPYLNDNETRLIQFSPSKKKMYHPEATSGAGQGWCQ